MIGLYEDGCVVRLLAEDGEMDREKQTIQYISMRNSVVH